MRVLVVALVLVPAADRGTHGSNDHHFSTYRHSRLLDLLRRDKLGNDLTAASTNAHVLYPPVADRKENQEKPCTND
jgi:hypothetical protein